MLFDVAVTEVRYVDSIYQIEAESESEALAKASTGDTVNEVHGLYQVGDRFPEAASPANPARPGREDEVDYSGEPELLIHPYY